MLFVTGLDFGEVEVDFIDHLNQNENSSVYFGYFDSSRKEEDFCYLTIPARKARQLVFKVKGKGYLVGLEHSHFSEMVAVFSVTFKEVFEVTELISKEV